VAKHAGSRTVVNSTLRSLGFGMPQRLRSGVEIPDGSELFLSEFRPTTWSVTIRCFSMLKGRMLLVERPVVAVSATTPKRQGDGERTASSIQDTSTVDDYTRCAAQLCGLAVAKTGDLYIGRGPHVSPDRGGHDMTNRKRTLLPVQGSLTRHHGIGWIASGRW